MEELLVEIETVKSSAIGCGLPRVAEDLDVYADAFSIVERNQKPNKSETVVNLCDGLRTYLNVFVAPTKVNCDGLYIRVAQCRSLNATG